MKIDFRNYTHFFAAQRKAAKSLSTFKWAYYTYRHIWILLYSQQTASTHTHTHTHTCHKKSSSFVFVLGGNRL